MGRHVVRVQAGCRLKKLNMWLQARGEEIPFQAEIGEATVGSVAAGDTKESSLNAPGYFSAHVVALTYVDDQGELHPLSDYQDGPAFYEFKCSIGLSGVVVECRVEVRPSMLCRSDVSVVTFASLGYVSEKHNLMFPTLAANSRSYAGSNALGLSKAGMKLMAHDDFRKVAHGVGNLPQTKQHQEL